MTPEHIAAMGQGRAESRVVSEYLAALRETKPKRGRKRTPESIKAKLAVIETELETASPLDELKLIQERRDLTTELEQMNKVVDLTALEDRFVEVAKTYGERKGISYASWRDIGVAAAVLKRAGIGRAAK